MVLVAHPVEVLRAFKAQDTPILMAAERGCWPQKYCTGMASVQYSLQSERSAATFRYLNSGCYMGYVWALKTMLREVLAWPVYEDQDSTTFYFLAHQHDARPLIRLDTQAVVFLCLTLVRVDELVLESGVGMNGVGRRWKHVTTGNAPLVLHGNGEDGIELLMSLLVRSEPALPLRLEGWQKNISAPTKSGYAFWMLEDPDQFAPRHLQPVDLVSFWYQQGSVALNSRNLHRAAACYSTAYEIFVAHLPSGAFTSSQAAAINQGLTVVRDTLMPMIDGLSQSPAP